MPEADPFDLERFVTAQAPVFATALAELKAGRKRSHWMWFIFPQLRGLKHSSTATFYGIGSCDEAQAYLAHPTLGPRLHLCTAAVLGIGDSTLNEVFGSPDELRLCSSMTLFSYAAGETQSVFRQALHRCCEAEQMDGHSPCLGRERNGFGAGGVQTPITEVLDPCS